MEETNRNNSISYKKILDPVIDAACKKYSECKVKDDIVITYISKEVSAAKTPIVAALVTNMILLILIVIPAVCILYYYQFFHKSNSPNPDTTRFGLSSMGNKLAQKQGNQQDYSPLSDAFGVTMDQPSAASPPPQHSPSSKKSSRRAKK